MAEVGHEGGPAQPNFKSIGFIIQCFIHKLSIHMVIQSINQSISHHLINLRLLKQADKYATITYM